MQTTFGKQFHLIAKLSEKRIIFILCHNYIDQPKEAALYEQYTLNRTTTHYNWTTAPPSPSQSLNVLVLALLTSPTFYIPNMESLLLV